MLALEKFWGVRPALTVTPSRLYPNFRFPCSCSATWLELPRVTEMTTPSKALRMTPWVDAKLSLHYQPHLGLWQRWVLLQGDYARPSLPLDSI